MSQITFVAWTPELLDRAARSLLRVEYLYSTFTLNPDLNETKRLLIDASPSTYALGTGGILIAAPLMVGLQAQCHMHIWDPLWLRRPRVLRSVAKDALERWNLQRLTGQIPARHTAAVRLALAVGFQIEGVMRDGVRYNEGKDDMLILGLLRGEV